MHGPAGYYSPRASITATNSPGDARSNITLASPGDCAKMACSSSTVSDRGIGQRDAHSQCPGQFRLSLLHRSDLGNRQLRRRTLFHPHASLHQNRNLQLHLLAKPPERLRKNHRVNSAFHIFQGRVGVHLASLRFQHPHSAEHPGCENLFPFRGRVLHGVESSRAERVQIFELIGVLFQRVPGDEESEHFFFVLQTRALVPVGRLRKRVVGVARLLAKDPKQAVLTRLRIAMHFLRLLHRPVENREQLRPPAERIHGSALDQRFEHPLVQQTQVDFLAKLIDRAKRADFLARFNN